jgi:hypothetical protein
VTLFAPWRARRCFEVDQQKRKAAVDQALVGETPNEEEIE